jgi:outer membrane protein assembly factor BamA
MNSFFMQKNQYLFINYFLNIFHKKRWHNVLYVMLLFLFSDCSVNRYLKNDEYFVNKNKIVLKNIKDYPKNTLTLELLTLCKQKAMTTRRARRYWKRKEKGENVQNSLPPAIFNDSLAQVTAQNMEFYLQNRGFLHPKVTYDKLFRRSKIAEITYSVEPNSLYVFDTVRFVCTDTVLNLLLNDAAPETLLRRNVAVDSRIFEQEKIRLSNFFQNLGYARFTPNYIAPLESDTFTIAVHFRTEGGGLRRSINATLTVLSPPNTRHQRFNIGEVNVYPNFEPAYNYESYYDSITQQVHIITREKKIPLKPSTLLSLMLFRPDSLYRREDIERTSQRFSNLDLFKFVRVYSNIDECQGNKVNFDIHLIQQKLMNFDGGLELNYTSVANPNLPNRVGVGSDLSFTHRNLFGRAERLSLGVGGGVDVNLVDVNSKRDSAWYTFRSTAALSVPRFADWGLLHAYRKLGILRGANFQQLKNIATTNLTTGFSFEQRTGDYTIRSFDLGYRFDWKRSETTRSILTLSGADLYFPKPTEQFLNRFGDDGLLRRTFTSNQLTTGFLFKSLSYTKNTKSRTYEIEGKKHFLNLYFEQSGAEIWAINSIFSPNEIYSLSNIEFSKYLKVEADYRSTRRLSDRNEFAWRVAGGVVVPFSSGDVPYLKRFFVGGPNSIRAWNIRELGPGSYVNANASASSTRFQTGDIKLDMSAEWRFPIYWILESALFVDVGNVWNLKSEAGREGTNITKNFYKQLAIGIGTGLRLNVTYAVIRIDVAYRLRNPYPDPITGFYIRPFKPLSEWQYNEDYLLNFAIGMPF